MVAEVRVASSWQRGLAVTLETGCAPTQGGEATRSMDFIGFQLGRSKRRDQGGGAGTRTGMAKGDWLLDNFEMDVSWPEMFKVPSSLDSLPYGSQEPAASKFNAF
jgi:hypothetical protein